MADRRIFTSDHAERLKDRAGQPYRPSNGTEGDLFEETWCADCRHRVHADGNGCLIFLRAWAYGIGEDDYPAEFAYGADGQPSCEAHDVEGRCTATSDIFATAEVRP